MRWDKLEFIKIIVSYFECERVASSVLNGP
jgi:hypothetical protein